MSIVPDKPSNRFLYFSVGFLIVLASFVYSSATFDPSVLPKLLACSCITLPVVVGWHKREKTGGAFCGSLVTDLPVLLYALIVLLQWPRALSPSQASIEGAKIIILVSVYFAISRVSEKSDWDGWTRIVTVSGAVVSGIGISQYLGFSFLWLPSAGLPSATFAYRNTAAMFVITVVPFSLYRLIAAESSRSVLSWTLAWTLLATFLLYTRTRGAWVACLTSMIVLIVLSVIRWFRHSHDHTFSDGLTRSKFIAFVVSVLVIGASGRYEPTSMMTKYSIPEQKQSIGDTFNSVVSDGTGVTEGVLSAGSGRFSVWLWTVRMIDDHFWLGVGLTNWEKYLPLYHDYEHWKSRAWRRPHNDYLWTFAELGVFGFLAYISILVSAVYLGIRATRHQDTEVFQISAACLAAFTAIQTHALFGFPRERIGPLVVGWLALATLTAASRPISSAVRKLGGPSYQAPLTGILVCLATFTTVKAVVSDILFRSAVASHRKGDSASALNLVSQATDFGVFDYRHLMYQTGMLVAQERIEEAFDVCRNVTFLHPNSLNGLRNLGEVASALDRHDVAVEAFSRTLALNPRLHDHYRRLGREQQAIGATEGALETYAKAAKQFPSAAWIPLETGHVYSRRGDYENALKQYEVFAGLDISQSLAGRGTDAFGHFSLADTYLRLGKPDKAIPVYLRGLLLDPENAAARYVLASLYMARSEPGQAIEQLESAADAVQDSSLKEEIFRLMDRIRQEP